MLFRKEFIILYYAIANSNLGFWKEQFLSSFGKCTYTFDMFKLKWARITSPEVRSVFFFICLGKRCKDLLA